MDAPECYENYPLWIPLMSLLQTIAIYGIGLYVFNLLGQIPLALYLLYMIWMELRVLEDGCRNCAYYGQLCGLGRGKLCGLIMAKGTKQKERFQERKLTWKDLIPDFLVMLLPLAAGAAIMLLNGFDWVLAALLLALLLLGTAGNGIIRGIVCAHCKQRKIGCPAEQLFQKK